jgi:hypothetical protein
MVCIKQSTSSPTYSWVLSLARFTTGCSTKFITMWLLDLLFPSLFHNQSSSAFKSMLLWCWCSQCCALCVFHVSMLAMMSMRGVLNTPSIPWNMSEMSEKILRHVSWDRWSIFVWKFCSSIWVQLFYRISFHTVGPTTCERFHLLVGFWEMLPCRRESAMPSTTKHWDLGVTSWCSCTSRGLQGNNIANSG